LSKEAFIATGVVIACLIDTSRLIVYSDRIFRDYETFNYKLVIIATLAAFAGAYIGNSLIKKITIKTLQNIVAVTLFLFALSLGMGII